MPEQLTQPSSVTSLPASRLIIALVVAAAMGAALGLIRPVRKEIVPRSAHVVHAQILLAIVGAMIMVVVAESLARAFAIVGAAGLVRYRARIKDPKDAGVLLVSLAVGLAAGAGLILFAVIGTAFVIGVLWLLESLEPPSRSRLMLRIATQDPAGVRAEVEYALHQKGVSCELREVTGDALYYELSVPFGRKVKKLTKCVEGLEGHGPISVEWKSAPAIKR
jgi:uncharacterized membrane protein YhiD involved in acid resistance